MRKKSLILFFVLCIQNTFPAVSIRICGPDGLIPFDFNNIMVGQKLTLIVNSDPNDYWSGGFFIEGEQRGIGLLDARNSDPNTRDFELSHYQAAGDDAKVWAWKDSLKWGFDLYSSDCNSVPGDWFILDYTAEESGQCQVQFYDYNASWTEPNTVISFQQDPSCDFNEDGIVNLSDYNWLSDYWLAYCDHCADIEKCYAVDLDINGIVDSNDLKIFARHWLWDGSFEMPKPEYISIPDPNLVYSVVDANGLGEISLEVGESIRLYVDLTTIDQNDLISFDIDVHISDPNAGTIINSLDPNTVDPNDMPVILAMPRSSDFDYISPGLEQSEGIHFLAYYFELDPNEPGIRDGHLASFVYTATDANDVELTIFNHFSQKISERNVNPTCKSIIIHHTNPVQMSTEENSAMLTTSTTTSTLSESDTSKQLEYDINETISFLEMIYSENDNLQMKIDELDWQEFIDNLKAMYESSK